MIYYNVLYFQEISNISLQSLALVQFLQHVLDNVGGQRFLNLSFFCADFARPPESVNSEAEMEQYNIIYSNILWYITIFWVDHETRARLCRPSRCTSWSAAGQEEGVLVAQWVIRSPGLFLSHSC